MRELKNGHNSVTVQNRTHVYMNFFDHKDLGNHLLQLCPKVVKHPVYLLQLDCTCNTQNSLLLIQHNGDDASQDLCMNYRCYQIIVRVEHFYTNRERCEVLTGYLSLRRRPTGDWENT